MTSSQLHLQVEDYLRLRRSLGFKLKNAGVLLASLVRYAEQVGHQGPLTTKLAVAWAQQTASKDPTAAARRLAPVQMFARHQAALDPATEIPPEGILGEVSRRRPQPHIYSDDEIGMLLDQCRQLTPRGGLRPVAYTTLFGLLACTGLRLSEACRLDRADVDLDAGVLTVSLTKFRKTRLVPLDPTAVGALEDYLAVRDARVGVGATGRLLRTERTDHLKADTALKTFCRIRQRLGWSAQGRAHRPRIHDLRHTFAVRRLLAWYVEGVDIDAKMLALSTYLGHAKPSDTYWYLSAIPELMAVTSHRFEHFASQQVRP